MRVGHSWRAVKVPKMGRERLFVVAPKLSAESIKDKGKTTRVDFALK